MHWRCSVSPQGYRLTIKPRVCASSVLLVQQQQNHTDPVMCTVVPNVTSNSHHTPLTAALQPCAPGHFRCGWRMSEEEWILNSYSCGSSPVGVCMPSATTLTKKTKNILAVLQSLLSWEQNAFCSIKKKEPLFDLLCVCSCECTAL